MHFKMLTFLFYIFYLLHTKVISCPTGAFLSNSGDKCYFVPDDTEVFELGEKACQTYDGHLASIATAFDNLLLTSELLKVFNSKSRNLWLGGNDVDTPGVWQWIDGSTMKYLNWAPGYPINSSATNCMLLDISNGLWYSESCYYSTSFVCEVYPNTSISTIYPPSTNYSTTTTTTTTDLKTTTTLPQNPCGDGTWTQIGNQCITIDPVKRDWSDAVNACHSLGGVLVTVFNQNDEDFLYAQAETLPFFIGLNDQASIGAWVWDQPVGKTLTLNDTKYINWGDGQPDTSNPNDRCVIDQGGVGWMVGSCNVESFYACGKPAII